MNIPIYKKLMSLQKRKSVRFVSKRKYATAGRTVP